MKQGSGLPVFGGIAMGPVVVFRKMEAASAAVRADPASEQAKFDAARETARQQLAGLYENALQAVGEEQAAIIEVQMLMLEDPDYLEAVEAAIAAGASAADAACRTARSRSTFRKCSTASRRLWRISHEASDISGRDGGADGRGGVRGG